jgi:lipopolysaccharide export system protein LptA
MKTYLMLLFGCALILPIQAKAQTQVTPAPLPAQQTPSNASQPIEITATKTVEWLRNEQKYVARENVIVTQGTMTLKTDLLTADYREDANSSTEIWQLTAEGNVEIADEKNTAYGDKAVYDVPTGVAVLTGQNLKLVSPDQTVTAKDRMEYHANKKKALAIGNAKVVRPKDTLSADRLTAYFKDDARQQPQQSTAASVQGGNLDRLEAEGNVVIKTPTETVYGKKGIYKAASNTAEISGSVKIERGPNILEGERAEVDLNTNVSRLFGSKGEQGRVRGVFFPGSEKKENVKTQPSQSSAPTSPASTPVLN